MCGVFAAVPPSVKPTGAGGAEDAGIPAILVRKREANVRHQCEDLIEAQHVIENTQQDASTVPV